MTLESLTALLADSYRNIAPEPSPCGVCGGPDARHRIGDAITERLTAGDDSTGVWIDYGIPIPALWCITARTLAVELELRKRRIPLKDWPTLIADAWPKS